MLAIEIGEVGLLCREATARGTAALNSAEWRRHDAIAAPRRRSQFLAGHWLARRCVAQAIGVAPAAVDIDSTAVGAPCVPHPPGLFLSLAHSGGFVACALSSAPVGIDLEQLGRKLDTVAAAEMVCTAAERKLLDAEGPVARSARFLQMWSLKEAWFKCRRLPMWLHAMTSVCLRPTPAHSESANALSWFDRDRDLVLSVVAHPRQILYRIATRADADSTPWCVEEKNLAGR